MSASFFFYDLETSGINAREARIMQFAGQRTDLDLNPIGEPINVLIRLTPDVVPEPDAILITGITPQAAIADGLTEAEFLKLFYDEVVKPDTIYLGFNSVRFDDEFMRFLHYRNFYDAYEWQWCDDCSRWDLLDVVRMTRALRPDGIEWPFTDENKPTNRLELLTKLNGLGHDHAHDALSDVSATIAVARLLKSQQKDLFEYLFSMRKKKAIEQLVTKGDPFVYTSGRFPSEYMHTTASVLLAKHAEQSCAYVYDLRHDPSQFLDMSPAELEKIELARYSKNAKERGLPIKLLRYNRCPAVAPLGVMNNESTQARVGLSVDTVLKHHTILKQHSELVQKLVGVLEKASAAHSGQEASCTDQTVDSQLYGNLFSKTDASVMRKIRTSEPERLSELQAHIDEQRLRTLLPLYKARNYPKKLSGEERAAYDAFCKRRLLDGGQNSRLANYFKRLETLAAQSAVPEDQRYILEELRLYGESLLPAED